jgi:hypothetical protein
MTQAAVLLSAPPASPLDELHRRLNWLEMERLILIDRINELEEALFSRDRIRAKFDEESG